VSTNENAVVRHGDRALTFREARDFYGVPEHRLRQYRSQRTLDFFKIGRAVFVSERSLVDFLERHRISAKPVQANSGPSGAGQPRARTRDDQRLMRE
jgi:hypothetical protein